MKRMYYGISMKGTFRAADFLCIEPCDLKSLHTGDIIAYQREDINSDPITHRIIRIVKDYVFTKGDNNKNPDILPVFQSNLIGKVVAFEREGKTFRVSGGIAGLILARMVFVFRRAGYLLICNMRKSLPVKKIANIVCFFWKPQIQKIKFSTVSGPLIKWVYRNHTVATWFPEKKLLETSFFYRFLLNPKKLK